MIVDQTEDLPNLGLIEGKPLDCLRQILKPEVTRGNNLLIHTDLKYLDIGFIESYDNIFHWHLKDSRRSLMTKEVNDPKFEFSYYDRIHTHFHRDQLITAKRQVELQGYSKPISTWDPLMDMETASLIPCLMTLSFRKVGEDLAMTVVFRARDIVRRLIPNWNALFRLQKELASDLKLEVGTLTDFSIAWFYKQTDLERLKSIL